MKNGKSGVLRRPWATAFRWHLSFLVAACALVSGQVVFALDANRALTQYFQRIWQVQQGLPQATILAIRQTADGYLWLGTPAGLIRFDGIKFTTLSDCAGVPAEQLWIHELCEDRQRRLWLATEGQGLICIRDDVSRQYTNTSGLPSNTVQALLLDKRGSIWAGTDAGLVRIAERLTVFSGKDGLAVTKIYGLCETQDGKIWIAGDGNKICIFDGTNFTTREVSVLPPDGAIEDLHCGSDGAVWAATSIGLLRIDADHEELFTKADGLADDEVLRLAEGRDGSLWVGTKEGFSRVRNREIASFGAADGLSQSTVYALWEDHEGSLWAGTKHGLNQFSDRRTVPVTMREGLPSNDVGPVCQDANGEIWVGTLNAGIACSDGRGFRTLNENDGLASNRVLSLICDTESVLWVGTDRGLTSLRNGRPERTYTTADGLPANEVKCLCLSNGVLWAGTSGGIAAMRDGKFVAPDGLPGDVGASIRSLCGQRDGTVLAAGETGLYRYTQGQYEQHPLNGVAKHDVEAIFEDADGNAWMGTQGSGLLLWDGARLRNFTTRQGLFDDDISGLAVDEDDRLWMASSSGVSYVPRKELLQFVEGSGKKLTSIPFRLTDSLRSLEAQNHVQPNTYMSSDGRIWLSTTRGLIVVNPRKLVRVLPPTPVVIEDVLIDGEVREPDELTRLGPGPTNLSFTYTALSLLTPMRITFRYKLEGFDADWVEAGIRREAFYTNLPPGQYRFRVAAWNVDETYWEAERPVSFTIRPHFYQTRWFLPLCALALGLAGWGGYRLRVRRIKEQMRAVVAERGRIARELHDTLMQGFSGVTMEMQALATRLNPSDERGTLEEIIRDAATCLRDARRSVAGLRRDESTESGLATLLADAAKRLTETRDVRLRLNLVDEQARLPLDVEYNLLRIMQEAVANAVKHSLCRSIEVTFERSKGQLLLLVRDDGIGFAAPAGQAVRPGHYGLIGIRERSSQLGGDLRIESEIGRGTTICVMLSTPEGETPRRVVKQSVMSEG